MLNERVRSIIEGFIPFPPSKEYEEYIAKISDGATTGVPKYGLGKRAFLDYYGRNKEGSEMGRLIIPWGDGRELEKSYHIKRTREGKFVVVNEGFYPR